MTMGRRPLPKEHPHVRRLHSLGHNRETIGAMLKLSQFQVAYRCKMMGLTFPRGRPKKEPQKPT